MVIRQQISPQEVQRTLADALGPAYRVSTESGSTVKVTRAVVLRVNVHVSCSDGTTSFRVMPVGGFLIMPLNALTTAPRVRHILQHAFTPSV